jgi:hypothetical protein
MIVLAYLWSQCTKFHAGGWTCWFFTSFYLESCILSDVISDSWSEAAACQRLLAASSCHFWRCNLLVEGYYWWWELDLHLWPWDKARILLMENEEKSQEHTHNFLWQQGDCSQKIRPGRLNSQFLILLWHFMVTAWKCAKTSPRILATKELAVASQQRIASHLLFH